MHCDFKCISFNHTPPLGVGAYDPYFKVAHFYFVFRFSGVKIDNFPYDVEDKLAKKLDAKRPGTKNWWDVGRKIGMTDSDLESAKREYDREGGSPTRCLIGIISTWHNVLSLRKFVETIHKLERHDICNAICEFYQSESSTA